MTNAEREQIFSKDVLTTADVQKLFECSRRVAGDIIRNIKLRSNRLEIDGGTKYAGKVHVQDYLDVYHLDRNSSRYNGREIPPYDGYEKTLPKEDKQPHAFYPRSVMSR
jgi:hypothetical protein